MAHSGEPLPQSFPQLPAHLGRKLRVLWLPSGPAILGSVLLYGLMIFYIATVYTVLLVLAGENASDQVLWGVNLIAILITALTFLPVRRRLQPAINQLVYSRPDPYLLLAQINQRLEATTAPDALLPTAAATIAATLNLPYVAVEASLAPQTLTAEVGHPPPHADVLDVPLLYGDTQVGTLRVAGRAGGDIFSFDDLKLLHDLARQVGITLYAAHLADALQRSRAELVAAREEERRRIRRDLHDSLGPTLAGLRLQLGALRRTLRQDPEEAERRIDELSDDVAAATGEIRRLVYDLRPPMLDEFGLVGALRNLRVPAEGLAYTVDAPDMLPPLPAALEVAVYRIAVEALHNVARHAQAGHCSVRLELAESVVRLTVTDDGRGLPADPVDGVGLASMRERAAELGGVVDVVSAPERGTHVTATIPLPVASGDRA